MPRRHDECLDGSTMDHVAVSQFLRILAVAFAAVIAAPLAVLFAEGLPHFPNKGEWRDFRAWRHAY
jgi:hypothetical protein